MILKITQLDGSSSILKLIPEESSLLNIGREEGDFILNDPLVSRNHLLIQWSKSMEHYFCEDLKTTNGTFLNGKPVDKSMLNQGDLIIIGDTWITVEDEIIDEDILSEIYQVLTSVPSEDQAHQDSSDETTILAIRNAVNSGDKELALKKLEMLENSFNEEKKVLHSLLEIGRMISSFLNMDKLVTFLINIIANIFDVSEGSIYINTPTCQKVFYLGQKKTDPDWDKLYASEFETDEENTHAIPIKSKTTTFGIFYIKTNGTISKNYSDILLILANNCAISLENIILYQKMEEIYLGTIRVLSAALESKDIYTIGHSERVMAYSILISAELGLTSEKLDDIKYAALLHDIGKIGIHENILNKPRKLTNDEFEIIKSHPTIGAKIIAGVDKLVDKMPAIKYHHEKWDGSGYPDGKREKNIPIEARIIAIADSFDAMTSNRAYRKALKPRKAIDILDKGKHQQFDPFLVDLFIRLFHKGKFDSILFPSESKD